MYDLHSWRELEIRKIKENIFSLYDDLKFDCLKRHCHEARRPHKIHIAICGPDLVVMADCGDIPTDDLELWVCPDRLSIVRAKHSNLRRQSAQEINISLPIKVLPDRCEARLRSGKLIVRLPQKTQAPARSILVRGAAHTAKAPGRADHEKN